jgi:hypothetical protein
LLDTAALKKKKAVDIKIVFQWGKLGRGRDKVSPYSDPCDPPSSASQVLRLQVCITSTHPDEDSFTMCLYAHQMPYRLDTKGLTKKMKKISNQNTAFHN